MRLTFLKILKNSNTNYLRDLEKILQIFPQMLSGNHLAYVAILNDLCDLENKVKVTRFELGFCVVMGPLCTKFGESLYNISSDIEQRTFQMTLNDLRDLENEVKVMRFHLVLHLPGLPWCIWAPNLVRLHQTFPSGNHFKLNLNDLRDLENKVKVSRFYLGLCLKNSGASVY